jgi:hypothetical protein
MDYSVFLYTRSVPIPVPSGGGPGKAMSFRIRTFSAGFKVGIGRNDRRACF